MNLRYIILFIVLLRICQQFVIRPQYETRVSRFGDISHHSSSPFQNFEQIILSQTKSQLQPQQYQSHLQLILEVSQNDERKRQLLNCTKGKPQYFGYLATQVGIIGKNTDYQQIKLQKKPDDCFQQVKAIFRRNQHTSINNTITIQLIPGKRKKQFCAQTFMFGTAANFHIQTISLRKHLKFTWKNINDIQINNIIYYGVHIFRTCDSTKNWFPDLLKTFELLLGGAGISKNPNSLKIIEKMNVNFVQKGTGYKWKTRKPVFQNLTQKFLRPGDFIAINKFDGLDQIIQYGTGSHAGHTAVIIQVEGVLGVAESQGAMFWPKQGIQFTPWQDWKKYALQSGFSAAILPLHKDARQKFNNTAAVQFFKKVQGYPYGYHNFLLGWIDTAKDNFPPMLDGDFVLVVYSLLEKYDEFSVQRILGEALNKRLGTKDLKLAQIAIQMSKKNLSFGQLLAIPQKDLEWYSDGYSFVCSSFVAATYKAAGIVPNLQGTQISPRDIYEMALFDMNYKVPEQCKRNDPTLPFCQIMGNYLMELPRYGTVQPYSNMCQTCPTIPPDYLRPYGC